MEKVIKGFPNYKINSDGYVTSINRNIRLKPMHNHKGYQLVSLYHRVDGKQKVKPKVIHRLVAEAFIPNPNNLPQVDHIDGNKEHNSVNNLQWISNLDNMRKAMADGLIPQTPHNAIKKTSQTVRTTNIFTGKTKEYSSISKFARSINRSPGYVIERKRKGLTLLEGVKVEYL